MIEFQLGIFSHFKQKRLYLVLLTASVTIMAITCDKEFTLQRKVPLKFLKAILDTSSLCEAGYLDDENCENVIPWEERKRYV